jgi:class 3 adenylate cyclase
VAASSFALQGLELPPSGTQRRTDAVVLFADLRGFTAMAEQLSPDVVVHHLNEFFSMLAEAVVRHEGRIFHMAGDCLMVGFGVEGSHEGAASRAATAARAMLDGFVPMAGRWKAAHGIEVGLGVGIHQGEVVAGMVGAEAYNSYTLIGDTVNVASRLCARARAGEMLFSRRFKISLDECGTHVQALELPALELRGRRSPVDIYCVPLLERMQATEGSRRVT